MEEATSFRPEALAALREQIAELSEQLSAIYRADLLPKEWLEADLTMPQLKALLVLKEGGTCNMSHLATNLGVSLPTATGLVERLVERDLVVRMPDPTDRRVVLCGLSGKGAELMERMWQVRKDMVDSILQPLTQDQLKTIAEALTILCRALQEKSKEGGAHSYESATNLRDSGSS